MPRGGPIREAGFRPDLPTGASAMESRTVGPPPDAVSLAKQQKEAVAREKWRHKARFVQSDYSSFDSQVSERKLQRYWCSHCGSFALVMESRLSDAPIRKRDCSRCIDGSIQLLQCPGFEACSKRTVVRRMDAGIEKLEIQFRVQCKSCKLTLGYTHSESVDFAKSPRLFILDDAIADEPTTVSAKVKELSDILAMSKK